MYPSLEERDIVVNLIQERINNLGLEYQIDAFYDVVDYMHKQGYILVKYEKNKKQIRSGDTTSDKT